MKKIIIAIAAIAAAFTMASCNKEQPVSPNDNPTTGKSVITGSIEKTLTKTTLDGNDTEGYKIFWSEGDKLFVADSDFEKWAAEYTLDNSSAGSSKGTFSWQTDDMFFPIDESCSAPVFAEGYMYKALYPFDLIDVESGAYIWKTEQTYSAADRYIPMVGAAECTVPGTAEFAFMNLGGLLRLTVKGTSTIKSIAVQANEPMSGEIAEIIDDDEGYMVALMLDETEDVALDAKHYITLDCGTSGVTLSEEGTDFYISMPCHYSIDETDMVLDGYLDVTITLTDTKGRTCEKKLNNKKLVIERSKITTATFTANEFKADIPVVALAGKFSVSADKQVYFSQGNLYYEDHEFGFEAEQNGSHGYAPGTVAWGHFGWSTSATDNHYGMSMSTVPAVYSGDFVDWGNAIGDGNTWRTLSKSEWAYLFNNHIYKWVSVDGVNGYAVAPDGFEGTIADSYYDCDGLAANNLVFLPAAGYRYTFPTGTYVSDANVSGFYWSSTPDEQDKNNAYYIGFYDENVSFDNIGIRSFGYSVRLVKDVTE